MCVCAEANRAAVAAKGGIEAVVAAMQRHAGVAGVAESGCGALRNIAGLGEFSAAVCARAVGGAGRGSCSAVRQCLRRGDVRACVRACLRWCVQCARTRWVVEARAGGACVRVGVWARSLGAAEKCVCVCLRVCIDVGARVVCVSASPPPVHCACPYVLRAPHILRHDALKVAR